MHPYTACWRVVCVACNFTDSVTKMDSDEEVVVDAYALIIAYAGLEERQTREDC